MGPDRRSKTSYDFARERNRRPAPADVALMEDMTTKVLIEIRDEIRSLRESVRVDIGSVREEVEKTNERLDRLERRQVEAEIRVATELTAVVGAIHELKDTLLEDRRISAQMSDHEQRITRLEARE